VSLRERLASSPVAWHPAIDLGKRVMRQEGPDSVSTLVFDQMRVAVANRPASSSLTFILAILTLVRTASSAYLHCGRGTRLAYRLEPHRLFAGRARGVGRPRLAQRITLPQFGPWEVRPRRPLPTVRG